MAYIAQPLRRLPQAPRCCRPTGAPADRTCAPLALGSAVAEILSRLGARTAQGGGGGGVSGAVGPGDNPEPEAAWFRGRTWPQAARSWGPCGPCCGRRAWLVEHKLHSACAPTLLAAGDNERKKGARGMIDAIESNSVREGWRRTLQQAAAAAAACEAPGICIALAQKLLLEAITWQPCLVV